MILTDAFWKTIVMKLGKKAKNDCHELISIIELTLNYEDKANNVINASGKAMNNWCQA